MKKIIIFLFASFMLSSCESQKTVTETKNTEISKLTDQQLMDKVQKDALKYFWDYAEPNSLLGRERYHEDDIYPDKDNPAGIYGELLYLYFIAAENKERYGN